jgi:phosphoglycerol geranylgeranyltransferase
MIGATEDRIKKDIEKDGTICFALIDSEEMSVDKAIDTVQSAERCGVSGILVGGSTAIDQIDLDKITRAIKNVTSLPVILFPGNITGICPSADAALFSSLLNSEESYFIIQAQTLGALLIKKYRLEPIPMGYIVIGQGGTIGFIGKARGIPYDKPNIVAMYALAAKYMGMRFIYLEAGSGVTSHVPIEMISAARNVFDGIIIVGGGIRSPIDAKAIAEAGADIIVVSTLLEGDNFEESLLKIIEVIKKR